MRPQRGNPSYPAFHLMTTDAERQRVYSAMDQRERDKFTCSMAGRMPPLAERQLQANRFKSNKQRMKERELECDQYFASFAEISEELPTVSDFVASPLAKFVTIAAQDSGYTGRTEDLFMTEVHPLFLQAKAATNKADFASWKEALRSEHASEWYQAAQIEVETLEKMKCWEVVDRLPSMKVLGSTWALRLKRYPDGQVKKFKARFCARGDQQVTGVDVFETWAPVAQLTTIQMMLILEVLLGLCSKQGDVTAAFVHALIDSRADIYVAMPHGFGIKGKKVLKLRRCLYGLKDSPCQYWLYTVKKMESCGLKQSTLDPCLFVGDKVICVIHVDDSLFWAKCEKDIAEVTERLRGEGVQLQPEDDTAGFLGIDLRGDPETGFIEMTQTGLIDRVIRALGLNLGNITLKWTPASREPLVKDLNGPPATGEFNYASVVGMLLYLSGNTQSDLAYAVNCCARYMTNARESHEVGCKRIGRYLKSTRLRGTIIQPVLGASRSLRIDCYPDADFAGLYGYERYDDPTCVKSRTGFVITLNDAPMLAKLSLQMEVVFRY